MDKLAKIVLFIEVFVIFVAVNKKDYNKSLKISDLSTNVVQISSDDIKKREEVDNKIVQIQMINPDTNDYINLYITISVISFIIMTSSIFGLRYEMLRTSS